MEGEAKARDKTAVRWAQIYRSNKLTNLPWEEGGPSDQLVELVESGLVGKGTILDICTGSGNNAIYLAQQGFSCFGIDISETAITYAKEKSSAAGVNCDFRVGDVLDLPFLGDMFEFVFDRGCFHSVSPNQRSTFIQEVHRVLKPSGRYHLTCFSKKDHRYGPPYPFSPKDIKRLFSGMFEIKYIKEITVDKGGSRNSFLSVLMNKPQSARP